MVRWTVSPTQVAAPEADVGGGEVAEALVVAPMIVVDDEGIPAFHLDDALG